jgi:hypothetical protein
MGTKELKKCPVRNVPSRPEQQRLKKNLFYRHDKPNKSTKEGPLSFVLFESPFISVSTVSWGRPSLVSLVSADKLSDKVGMKSIHIWLSRGVIWAVGERINLRSPVAVFFDPLRKCDQLLSRCGL